VSGNNLHGVYELCSSITDKTCHNKCSSYFALQDENELTYTCTTVVGEGFYEFSDGVYYRCADRCATCSEANYCNSCSGSKVLTASSEPDKYTCEDPVSCSTGQYAKDNICQPCAPGCATCEDGTHCTSCDTDSPVIKYDDYSTNSSYTCVASTDCDFGYFASTNNICTPCTEADNTVCGATGTACADFLWDGTKCIQPTCSNLLRNYTDFSICSRASNATTICYAQEIDVNTNTYACTIVQPSEGYYETTTPTVYNKCTIGCSTCNINGCMACSTGYLLNNTCADSCGDGYFADSTNHLCTACSDSNCKTCISDAAICTACSKGYLLNNACADSCGDGYFADSTNHLCTACSDSNCKTCNSDAATCTACSKGYLLNNTCTTSCGDGYYADNTNQQCIKCSDNCATCSEATYCLSCSGDLVMTATNFEGKYTCNSAVTCTEGQYVKENVCNPCDSKCKTCSNGESCLTIGTLTKEVVATIVLESQPSINIESGIIETTEFSIPSNKKIDTTADNHGCEESDSSSAVTCPLSTFEFVNKTETTYTGRTTLYLTDNSRRVDADNTYTFTIIIQATSETSDCTKYESTACPAVFECIVINRNCVSKTTNTDSNINNADDDDDDDGLSGGAIAGIIIVCIIVVCLIIVIVVVVIRNKSDASVKADVEICNLEKPEETTNRASSSGAVSGSASGSDNVNDTESDTEDVSVSKSSSGSGSDSGSDSSSGSSSSSD